MQAARQHGAGLAQRLGGLALAGLDGVEPGVVNRQTRLLGECEHELRVVVARGAAGAPGVHVQQPQRVPARTERGDDGGFGTEFAEAAGQQRVLVARPLETDGLAAPHQFLEGDRPHPDAAGEWPVEAKGEDLAGACLALVVFAEQPDEGPLEPQCLRRRFRRAAQDDPEVEAARQPPHQVFDRLGHPAPAPPRFPGLHPFEGQPQQRREGEQLRLSLLTRADEFQHPAAEGQGAEHAPGLRLPPDSAFCASEPSLRASPRPSQATSCSAPALATHTRVPWAPVCSQA